MSLMYIHKAWFIKGKKVYMSGHSGTFFKYFYGILMQDELDTADMYVLEKSSYPAYPVFVT